MEPVLFGLLVFAGIVLVFFSMLVGQQLDPVQARLQQIAVRPRTLEELELQRPLTDRTLKPIIQGISRLIGRFYPANTVKSVSLKLKRAGMEGTSVEFFLGVKGFAAVVGAIAGSTILNLLTLDPRTRPIPMIVCSAAIQSLHEHQEWLSRYGIRALPKPFDLDMLLTTIEEMIAEHRARD